MHFSCKKPDITPAYLILTVEDFEDCVDVSNFNKVHNTNYDQYELDAIKQHEFKDASVRLNGRSLAPWNIPCRIPLLPEDYSKENYIWVMPCVRMINTGVVDTEPYPFLSPVQRAFNLEKEGEYRFPNLKFEYVEWVSFPVLETYALQTTRFTSQDTAHGANIEFGRVDERLVMKLAVTEEFPYFNIATAPFELFGQGTRQFWELSYKCEGEITASLNFTTAMGIKYTQDMVVLRPTRGVWRKVYIDITEEVSLAAGSASRVSVGLNIRGNRMANSGTAHFYFENMKLVTMQAPN